MEVAAIFPENKRYHTDCKKGIEFDMEEKGFVEKFYQKVNEEERLSDRPGQIEYATTMAYIHQYLQTGMRIAEIGAGTGRYSLALSREGYQVEAVLQYCFGQMTLWED